MTSPSIWATASCAPSARLVDFVAKSVRSNTRRTFLRGYENEIDLFIVYCPETDGIYVIPIEEATSSVGALRVAPTANGQAKRIRWARDYELAGVAQLARATPL
jgi:hypothetical protein